MPQNRYANRCTVTFRTLPADLSRTFHPAEEFAARHEPSSASPLHAFTLSRLTASVVAHRVESSPRPRNPAFIDVEALHKLRELSTMAEQLVDVTTHDRMDAKF